MFLVEVGVGVVGVGWMGGVVVVLEAEELVVPGLLGQLSILGPLPSFSFLALAHIVVLTWKKNDPFYVKSLPRNLTF